MIRLVRAEFGKVRTTQVWIWMLLAAVAIAALFVVGPIASGDFDGPVYSDPRAVAAASAQVADLFSAASLAYIVVFVLGVLGVTTEFRYQTITPTLLQTPSRWTVVAAKMITYALLGVAYSAICVAVQLAIALPWLATKHVHYSLGDGGVPHALIGVFVVIALFGIVGLGVGALLKNQIVAVSVGVIFLVALQNVIVAVPGLKLVYPYLPGGAANAIVVTDADRTINDVSLLPVWGGVVVLLLWAFVPAVLGAAVTLNRDIS